MPNILFWNVNRRALSAAIGDICEEHALDCLVLAECCEKPHAMLSAINRRRPYFKEVFPFNTRIRVFVSVPTRYVVPVLDEGGVSIRRLRTPLGDDLMLVLVHLGSKLRKDVHSQSQYSTHLSSLIVNAEQKLKHSRTIVMGDFNMDPFEIGMVSSEGLHSTMSRRIAATKSRKVGGKRRDYFYNPMWSQLGDRSAGPPGTYFYYNSNEVSYFWHTFDQVLLRPSLLPQFEADGIAVLTTAGSHSLLNDNGRPNKTDFTDHLPILLRLRPNLENL